MCIQSLRGGPGGVKAGVVSAWMWRTSAAIKALRGKAVVQRMRADQADLMPPMPKQVQSRPLAPLFSDFLATSYT